MAYNNMVLTFNYLIMEEKEEVRFEDWNASELFHYLRNAYVISPDDEFEDWLDCRADMIKAAYEFDEE